MGDSSDKPSSWLYPDRDAWDELLKNRPRPKPVTDKPPWWRGPWPGRWPGQPKAGVWSSQRQLETLRGELSWARRCFYFAQSAFQDHHAGEQVGQIAEALGRARACLDAVEKVENVAYAMDELTGVGKYNPSQYPEAFVDYAGRSVASAGAVLAGSRFESVAYWGRMLSRLGRSLRTTKHQLPGR